MPAWLPPGVYSQQSPVLAGDYPARVRVGVENTPWVLATLGVPREPDLDESGRILNKS